MGAWLCPPPNCHRLLKKSLGSFHQLEHLERLGIQLSPVFEHLEITLRARMAVLADADVRGVSKMIRRGSLARVTFKQKWQTDPLPMKLWCLATRLGLLADPGARRI
jgi:hypothetical protein